jgi:hypothetical protein
LSLELVKLQLQLVKLRLQLLGPLLLRLQPHLTFVTIYELGYPHPDEGKSYDNGRYPHQRLSHMTLRRMVPEWHTLYPNQTIDKKILPFVTASLAGACCTPAGGIADSAAESVRHSLRNRHSDAS